jgi:hypothetical protein
MEDVINNDTILNKSSSFKKVFRFPFLAEGESKLKTEVYERLDKLGYQNLPPTVDPQDWRWNQALLRCYDKHLPTDTLIQDYVELVTTSIIRTNSIMKDMDKASPQIVLFHYNAINEASMHQILDKLSGKVTYITVDQAIKSKVITTPTSYSNNNGLSLFMQLIDVLNFDTKDKKNYFDYYNNKISSITEYCK